MSQVNIHPWRYKNLNKNNADNLDRDYEILNKQLETEDLSYDPSSVLILIERRYCYGRPMENVIEAIRLNILLELKLIKYLLIKQTSEVLKNYCFSGYSILETLGFCYLISDDNLCQQVIQFARKLLDVPFPPKETYIKFQIQMILNIVEHEKTESLIPLAEQCVNLNPFMKDDVEQLLSIANKKSEELNKIMEEELINMVGSVRTRERKKDVLPRLVFRVGDLAEAAFLLNQGIPLTFKDPAIPIWDFPIAQRPEIKAILPV